MTSKQSAKYKKFILGAASAALVASAVAPVVASAKDFNDTVGNTHEVAINALSDAGVITGYPDGSFLPNKTLTRSDVVKLMGKWLVSEGYKVPTDYKTNMRFKDLTSKSNDELLQYAAVVKENGVFNGSNGNLLAGDNITRENMAVVIVRAFDQVKDMDLVAFVAAQDFKKDVIDLAKAKAEARPAIDVLDFFDITNPAAPTFNPKNTTTRGQFATFLHKSINTDFSAVKAPEVDVDKVAVDAAAEQVKAGAVTVSHGEYATDANKLAAVQTYVTSLVTEKDVVATVAAGKTAGEYVVTLTKGEAKVEKTIAMTFEFTAEDLIVTEVNSITKTNVKVTIKALLQDEATFTVDVLDDKGNTVEVTPVSLEKGETEATLTFKTPLGVDPTGVWVVGAVKYDNDAIKNYNDIVTASNEVTLLAALKKAGLTNVKDGNITSYAIAINASTTKETLADIQKLIDTANESSITVEEQAAAVKAVNEAANQVQLLAALQNKAFSNVNPEWIVAYKVKVDALTITTSTPVATIQAAIVAANTTAISNANGAATTVASQNAVTDLIKKYVADDVATSTVKADQIKLSETKAAVFGVKEATTAATLYNVLVKLSALDSTGLPAASLNENLKSAYLVEKNSVTANFTDASTIATSIVTAADTKQLAAALLAINELDNTSTPKQIKDALQKLTDVTSHKTGANKFDMSSVKDENLVKYVTLAGDGFAAATINSINLVNAAIANVELNTALETVNSQSVTAAQASAALLNLAVVRTATQAAKADADAFISLSSQARLEVAQLVIDARPVSPGYANLDALISATGTGAVQTQQAEHVSLLAKFNAIGDLTPATTAKTKDELDTYAYAPYVALSASQKVAVAEEINKLTKTTTVGGVTTTTSLNFASTDAVKTLKQANDYIDAAIAKVK